MDDDARILADEAAVLLALLTEEGVVERVNAAVLELCGRAEAEVVGQPFAALVHGEDRDSVGAALRRCVEERRRVVVLHRVDRGHGQPRWCETVLVALDDDGRRRVHASCYDVSSHRRLEEVLETSQALFHAVFDTANEAIVATDEDLRIVLFNRAAQRLFDYGPDEVLGRHVELLFPGEMPFTGGASREVRAGGVFEGTGRRRAGSEFSAEVTVAEQMLDGQYVVTGVIHNVTRRKQREAELDRRANYDALTRLPNRTMMTERLEQAISHAKRTDELMGVLYVDLDGFKDVNDAFGHATGDRLLHSVARRLERSVRATDVVARIGGDEFVVVLAHLADAGDAVRIAEVIRRRLSSTFHIANHDLRLTCSVGIALFPDDGVTPQQLVDRADRAMYRAKQVGKDCVQRYDGGGSTEHTDASG